MADYKEATIAGTMWRRAKMINIWNPLQGTPRLCITEEDVVRLANDQVIQSGDASFINVDFDASATFAVLDPTTGAPTGATMSQAEVYAIIYSLYMDLAAKRDAPPITGDHPGLPPLPMVP